MSSMVSKLIEEITASICRAQQELLLCTATNPQTIQQVNNILTIRTFEMNMAVCTANGQFLMDSLNRIITSLTAIHQDIFCWKVIARLRDHRYLPADYTV